MDVTSLPHTLWHLYADNLVYYEKGSWVNSVASTCRILAFATIVPFILLTLLVRIPLPRISGILLPSVVNHTNFVPSSTAVPPLPLILLPDMAI
ncbi:hypothetical protein C8Q80DRAFT_1184762 [Daedaleopsis nitida]|nr:hypothetical protein C8Q80DRAFT_1184762 [Daedaleopsis nitida]